MNETIASQIEELKTLNLTALRARFAEILGETTRAPNKTYLIRRITEALEARAAETPEPESAPEAPTAAQDASAAAAEEGTEPGAEAPSEADSAPLAGQAAQPRLVALKLTKLDVDALRERYVEVVGRPTGSTNKSYLIWKIRQAEQGKVPVGPRGSRRASGEAAEMKVLPLRMEADHVEALDGARERLGLRSRMELFRRSLHAFLLEAGEVRVAELFAAAEPTSEATEA